MLDKSKLQQLKQKLPENIRKFIPKEILTMTTFKNINTKNCEQIASNVKHKTILTLLQKQKFVFPEPIINDEPIILVFCQPSQEVSIDGQSIYPYVPVSYCNWLQGAGARCIPLPYNLNQGSMEFLIERSHGLLIPGGGSNLYKNYWKKQGHGPVTIGFQKIWRFIQKLWNKGVHYPIWGTCLGLQIMLIAISNDIKILSNLNSRMHQLQIYSDCQESVIMKNMPKRLKLAIQNNKIINFQHAHGISVHKFLNNLRLQQKLKITSISKDKDGKWFCSALQGKQNPIFLTQFHPQKQAYQWSKNGDILHQRDSVDTSQYLATAFVQQCRKCKPLSNFNDQKQQTYHIIHQYKQIHTPLKLYKVFAIDFKYRDHQSKKLRNNSQRTKTKSVKLPFI